MAVGLTQTCLCGLLLIIASIIEAHTAKARERTASYVSPDTCS